MADLRGARVALLEARMKAELAGLVERHGGTVRLAPAVREISVDASGPVTELLDELARERIQVVIFMTGVGSAALFREAETLGRLDELIAGLQNTVNVSRGQKPWPPLKKRGVPISVTVREPYTTNELIEALEPLDLAGKGVAVLHYGERNATIAETVVGRGARLLELCLYEWRLPDDVGPLEQLVAETIAGELDVVAFTSQVQVRHLFQIAEKLGQGEALAAALNHRTVVAAVGPTCADALIAVGVTPKVVPTNPKMGPMVVAISDYLQGRDPAEPGSGARDLRT